MSSWETISSICPSIFLCQCTIPLSILLYHLSHCPSQPTVHPSVYSFQSLSPSASTSSPPTHPSPTLTNLAFTVIMDQNVHYADYPKSGETLKCFLIRVLFFIREGSFLLFSSTTSYHPTWTLFLHTPVYRVTIPPSILLSQLTSPSFINF